MSQDDDPNQSHASGSDSETPTSDILQQKQLEFDEKLRQCETEFGPKHETVADILDAYAAFLRTHHMRTLDAANFSARARAIRGKEPPTSRLPTDNLEFARRKTGRGGKKVIFVCCGLVMLLAGSIWLYVMEVNHLHNGAELDVDRKEREQLSRQNSAVMPGAVEADASSGLIDVNRDDPGNPIAVEALVVPNKTAILYFHSDYCLYFSQMEPLLRALAQRRADLLVYVVYIDRPGCEEIDYQSPVASQFDIHSVPQFRIYDGQGAQVAGADAAKAQVKRWMQEAGVVI